MKQLLQLFILSIFYVFNCSFAVESQLVKVATNSSVTSSVQPKKTSVFERFLGNAIPKKALTTLENKANWCVILGTLSLVLLLGLVSTLSLILFLATLFFSIFSLVFSISLLSRIKSAGTETLENTKMQKCRRSAIFGIIISGITLGLLFIYIILLIIIIISFL